MKTKNLNLLLFLLIGILYASSSMAQTGHVGVGTNAPKARLHIDADSSGILIPAYTDLATLNANALPQLNATDHQGLLVFVKDSTDRGFWFYNGTAFEKVGASTGTDTLSLIADMDRDTRIEVEASPDEDMIRFYMDSSEVLQIGSTTNGFSFLNQPASGNNVLLGNLSGNSLTGPSGFNTFVGNYAGLQNDGVQNVFLGNEAGRFNVNGWNNTFLGFRAGYNNTGGSNVFIGFRAGENETGGSKLVIDNSNTTTPLIYGDFSTDYVRINGSFEVVDGTEGNGKVFTSDANGAGSWQTLPPSDTLSLIADTDGDTRIEVEANPDEDRIRFYMDSSEVMQIASTSNGYSYLAQPGNGSQLLIGNLAGNDLTGALNGNTMIGNLAGFKSDGGSNVYLGSETGRFNVNGSSNTFLGYRAGYNSTGGSNVFIGYQAGENETGGSKLVIDNSGTTTPLIYGDFSTDYVRVNGSLEVVDGTEGNGKVFTSDANGAGSWQTPQPNTDNQSLSLMNDTLSITNANAVDLSGYLDNTDNQTLSLSGDTLSISNGNSIVLSQDTLSLIADTDGDTKIQTEESADEDIIRFDVNGSQRMMLDAAGNLGIGITPSYQLHVGGFSGGALIGGTLLGNTTGSARLSQSLITSADDAAITQSSIGVTRISAVENTNSRLFIGLGSNNYAQLRTVPSSPSSSGWFFNYPATTNFFAMYLKNDNSSSSNTHTNRYNGLQITAGRNTNNGANSRMLEFRRPDGTVMGSVNQTGSNSVNYSTTSDIRLKTNIKPTHFGVNDLMKIEVKDYVYKDERNAPTTGFIAQQLYTVYPDAVSVGGDDPKVDPWMVEYSKLTPLVVKAMQDQQKQIEQQQKKIEQLEAALNKLLSKER